MSSSSSPQAAAQVPPGLGTTTARAADHQLRMALGVFIHRPELAQETATRASASDDSLALWLQMAHEAGRLQVDDPARAASQFWALIKGELFWPTIFSVGAAPSGERRAEIVDAAIELFLCRYGVD